jgi:TRC40/GET3/ArsA family transport-energizing ATPase
MPGIDEAMALSKLSESSLHYDRVVIDTAPTGHTLRLLALPKLLGEAITRLSAWDTTVGGFLSYFSSGEDSTQKLREKLVEYKTKAEQLATLFTDSNQSTFVCVCIAEHLSVHETARLVKSLRDQNVSCRHVLVNQLLPVQFQSLTTSVIESASLPPLLAQCATLSGSRARIQARYLWQLEQALNGSGIAVLRLPMENKEVRGSELLTLFGTVSLVSCFMLLIHAK